MLMRLVDQITTSDEELPVLDADSVKAFHDQILLKSFGNCGSRIMTKLRFASCCCN